MKNPSLHWHCDSFGVCNLVGPADEHLWINKRPVYCDRGHWELGAMGMHMNPQPAHYFQRLATAQREAELWLARSLGRPVPEGEVACPMGWKATGPAAWQRSATGPTGLVMCQVARSGTAADPLWTWTVPEGLSSHPDYLDASDAFPRHFLRASHAVSEVEAFLKWRLEKVHTEIPEMLSLPDEPVTGPVKDHIQGGTSRRPRSRLS